MKRGIIVKGVGGKYTVFDGKDYFECVARGIFRKDKIIPLPGDSVEFSDSVINVINVRKNVFIRPAVANIDQLAFFLPVKYPEPDLYLLDKLLLTAFENDVTILLCINKCDCDDNDIAVNIKRVYEPLDIKVFEMEASNGIGIDRVTKELAGKTTVFAGQSGAGKSTAINGVFQKEIMKTGDISRKTERGKHTTRHAELLLYENGFVVDTPGFSSHELPDLTEEKLKRLYPEFMKYAESCRFKECSHINEPNCAVKEALEDKLIDSGRYDRYVRFNNEVKERKANRW